MKKKYQRFLPEIFQFLEVKFSIYLNRLFFVMGKSTEFIQSPLVTRGPTSKLWAW